MRTRTFAAAIAVTALVVPAAAEGARQISGKDIRNNSITSADIRNGTIGTRDISTGTIAALKGQSGPAGPQGPQGAQGAQGERGPAGPAGERGPAGPTTTVKGDVVTGPAGPKGDRGPEGPAGPQGPQGPQGAAGPAGTFGKVTYRTDDGYTVACADGEVAVSGGATYRDSSTQVYFDGPILGTDGTTPIGWRVDSSAPAYYGVYAICAAR